jgi:GMP synthase (glutamine-hydrolysing)
VPANAAVFQWRSEGFDLPVGAVHLASSINFENQAFPLGTTIYGLQFHIEVTHRMIERWLYERSKISLRRRM